MKPIIFEDFQTCQRDRFVDAAEGRGARLAPSFLLTHEMGVDGDRPEQLSPTEWSKVVFEIPSAHVKSAELLFYVCSDTSTQTRPMRLWVNGHRISHRQKPERMLTGGWDRASIPVRYLRPGINEFVFSHSGVLYIDPGEGGHSSRSFDGGQTWHPDALGPDADVAGEYLVRLRLRGYPPRGQLTSNVIDLADPEGRGRLVPRLEVRRIALVPRTRTPQGTAMEYEVRTGSTPVFDPRTWTPWEKAATPSTPQRFLQWRATLSTNQANRTPVLTRMTIKADMREKEADLEGVSLLELDQPEIARSSYSFTYLGSHPRYAGLHPRVERLRKQYRLEEVIAPGKTELEQLALLRDWVHSQWLGWQSSKYPYCPPWDPLEILEVTKGNWGYGMCTHYAATFAACAAALGWVSRSLIVDHHCLTEVWCDQLQKWILEDPGPGREHDATYEYKGTPINALEFHRFHVEGTAQRLTINKLPQGKSGRMTADWGKLFVRFGIPLRNDHLVRAEPAELHHGYSQYHWDGYLWWTDDLNPRYAEYPLQTNRPEDFYWSVNQTRLYPQATEEPGVLEVQVESVTPNLSHFLVQMDGGEWVPDETPVRWPLHPGENSLAVRSVNAFGRTGRVAHARVRMEG